MFAITSNRPELRLIIISFCATAILGSGLVCGYWWWQNAVFTGVGRGTLFVTIMAAVHIIGGALYFGQNRSAQADASPVLLDRAVKAAVMQYGICLLITAALLDGGFLFRSSAIALLAHSSLILATKLRRPDSPTELDVALIRYAFLPTALIISRIAEVIL